MTPRSTSRIRQRGIALIVSLLVVAIVAGLALMFTARQQLWMRQIENRNNFSMAQGVAIAAIDMSRLTLRDDGRNNKVDHLLEPWTIPIPPIAVEEGRISGRITELQGKLNLTNLLPPAGTPVKEDTPALQRASRAFGLSNSDLVKLLQAFQTLRKREPSGTPELPELLRLAALQTQSSELARRHLQVLPEKTPINANFASAEVLQASIQGLSSGDAAALVARRTGKPFMNMDELTQALPAPLRDKLDNQSVDIQSRYFMVDIDAWFNEMHMGFQAQLRRQSKDMPVILWVRRSTLEPS
jgi:general secretion pathway protein K